jgi:hypothetical protein
MFHRTYCEASVGNGGRGKGRERWGRIVVGWVDFSRPLGAEAGQDGAGVGVGEELKKMSERFAFEFVRIGVEEAFSVDGKGVGIEVQNGRGTLDVLSIPFFSPLLADLNRADLTFRLPSLVYSPQDALPCHSFQHNPLQILPLPPLHPDSRPYRPFF